MKPGPIQIQIDTPCQQNWDSISPVDAGRHCQKCNRTVIDLTNWTYTDLYNFFSKDQGKICGRLFTSQTERTIKIAHQPSSKLYRIVIAFGLILTFNATPDIYARVRPQIENSVLISSNDTTKNSSKTGTISGLVLNERGEKMTGCIVEVVQNGKKLGGAEVLNGTYSINGIEGGKYELIARCAGYKVYRMTDCVVKPGKQTKVNINIAPWVCGDVFYVPSAPMIDPDNPSKSRLDNEDLKHMGR